MRIQNGEFIKHTPPTVCRSAFEDAYLCTGVKDAVGRGGTVDFQGLLPSRGSLGHWVHAFEGKSRALILAFSLTTCLARGGVAVSNGFIHSHLSPHQRPVAKSPPDHDLESSKALTE